MKVRLPSSLEIHSVRQEKVAKQGQIEAFHSSLREGFRSLSKGIRPQGMQLLEDKAKNIKVFPEKNGKMEKFEAKG